MAVLRMPTWRNVITVNGVQMSEQNRVVVTDVQIPFTSMVILLVKWAIAAIPAIFILALLGSLAMGLMAGFAHHSFMGT